jgi:hypothetical protein
MVQAECSGMESPTTSIRIKDENNNLSLSCLHMCSHCSYQPVSTGEASTMGITHIFTQNIHAQVYTDMYACMYISVWFMGGMCAYVVDMCVYVCVCLCAYVYMCVCMFVFLYVCMCKHVSHVCHMFT